MRARALLLAGFVLAGCTTVGLHDNGARSRVDFAEPVTVRVCALLDDGITAVEAAALLETAWRDEVPAYGVRFTIVESRRWPRPAAGATAIMAALAREPLPPACDRLLAILAVGVGDVVRTLLWPTPLGASALTHAYVLTGMPGVLHHELHHLLGCEHALSLARCYERIAALKRARQDGFFPAWSRAAGRMVTSREEINRLLGGAGAATAAAVPDPA
ncbi:MAG: hypothetical protein ACREMB_25635 [Candidatus Rokuibacteriota bacterium]